MLAYREEYAILRLDKVSNRARERRTKMAQNKDKPTNKLVVLATIIGIAGFFGLVFSPAGHAVSNRILKQESSKWAIIAKSVVALI
jgi:hypothetical protein